MRVRSSTKSTIAAKTSAVTSDERRVRDIHVLCHDCDGPVFSSRPDTRTRMTPRPNTALHSAQRSVNDSPIRAQIETVIPVLLPSISRHGCVG